MARGIADQETYQPRVMPEDLPRKVVPEMSGNSIGSGITHIADVLQAKYQSDSATYAGDEIAKARVKAVTDLEAAKNSAPPGDQTGFTAKYLANFDKNNADLVQSAGGNKIAGQMIDKGLSDLRDTLATHSLQWESQQNVAYRKDSVVNNTEAQLAIVEAHPELKQQVGSTLFDQIRSVGGGNETMLPLMRGVDAKLSLAAANGLTRQNPQGMYDALNNPEKAPAALQSVLAGLSDQQREAVRAKAQGQISAGYSNSVVDAYRHQGPVAGAQSLTAIDKLDQPPEIKEQIRAEAEKGIAQWHQEARQAHAQDIIGLEERLASGKTNPSDPALAMQMWRQGVLTPDQAGEIRGRIEKAQEKQVEDQAWTRFANAAYQNGQGLDPENKHARDAVGDLFEAHTQGVQPGSAEWINRAADISQKTGITPDPVIQWSRTALVSGSPPIAAQAADTIQRQQDANPRGVGFALDDRTKAMAKLINDAVHAGTDSQVAVENARKITSMPDADRQRLGELYSANQDAIKKGTLGSLSAELKADPKFKTGWFDSKPTIPPSMVGEYEELRQNYFKLTNGNVQQASDLAYKDLKNTWGVTQVNGTKEYMQFAPESMNPGLSTESLRQDMEASAKGHAEDPSKVRLIATPDTYHSQGQRWGLGVPDKFGAYDVIRDARGNPLAYQLPTAAASIHADQAKAASEGLAKLHTIQQAARESEKAEWAAIEAERGAPHNRLNY